MSANRDSTALRLGVLKVIAEHIGQARTEAINDVRSTWSIGDRLTARTPYGHPVASVLFKSGATGATVSDRAAFTAWAIKTYPTEIETVTEISKTFFSDAERHAAFLSWAAENYPEHVETKARVRPAFEGALIKNAKKIGQPLSLVGEVVPGLTVSKGDPIPEVTLDADATAAVAEAWQDGYLYDVIGSALQPRQIDAPPVEVET